MNILIDQNSVALFFGDFELTDIGVQFLSGGVNNDYTTANSSVIDAEAPEPALPHTWKWENNAWVCINQEAVNAYFADQKTAFNVEQKKKRFAAYTVESDPIFFKSQRGEATNQQWLDAVAAIDARFPYQA
jgi:hypothetical protein